MEPQIITAVALGIGLAASSGFRVFVPLLAASIAARMGLFPVQEGFLWLAEWPTLILFGVATLTEILAYYIPLVDNLLDGLTTPLAIGAGTLLLTSVLPSDSELLKWVTGFQAGGGAAATIQGGSAITRALSTTTTAGLGNPVVATTENTAAIGTSILTFIIPIVIALLAIVLVAYLLIRFGKRLIRKRKNGS